MKYCGIDLHSNNSVVSVVDEQDHVVAEKRLSNDLAKIIGLIKPWRTELAGIVVESTFNWYWLVDGLKEAGFTVYLAHTTAIKKYEGLKHSGDEADARYLAHLLRLGILPTQNHTGTRTPRDMRSGQETLAVDAQPYHAHPDCRKHHGAAKWFAHYKQSIKSSS